MCETVHRAADPVPADTDERNESIESSRMHCGRRPLTTAVCRAQDELAVVTTVDDLVWSRRWRGVTACRLSLDDDDEGAGTTAWVVRVCLE